MPQPDAPPVRLCVLGAVAVSTAAGGVDLGARPAPASRRSASGSPPRATPPSRAGSASSLVLGGLTVLTALSPMQYLSGMTGPIWVMLAGVALLVERR